MDLLDRLLGHDAWTTGRLLEQSRGLSDQQLDQDFDLGHRTVRRTLEHIIGNMEDWTALMTAAPIPEHPGPATLDELRVRLDSVSRDLARLAHEIQADGRWDDLWTDTLDSPPRQKTYGGAIAHVLTHSMHHRAQLIHMLKRLEVPDVIEGDVLGWEGQRT